MEVEGFGIEFAGTATVAVRDHVQDGEIMMQPQ